MEVTSKLVDVVADQEDDPAVLPGFRFHPTDEELVGFYLRRKVEKKPIAIEIIKQIDIYKYDPWDLPSKKLYLINYSHDHISLTQHTQIDIYIF